MKDKVLARYTSNPNSLYRHTDEIGLDAQGFYRWMPGVPSHESELERIDKETAIRLVASFRRISKVSATEYIENALTKQGETK